MGSDSTRWADAIKAAELALLSSAVRHRHGTFVADQRSRGGDG